MERAPSNKTFERAIETESVREMVNCDTVAAVTSIAPTPRGSFRNGLCGGQKGKLCVPLLIGGKLA